MTIYGPDISNNNGVVDIDRVADEGFDFVFAKVSEGSGFKDRFWPRTRDWCAARGLICVGYHYVTTDDPVMQAWNFHDNGGGSIVMFDFEANSGDIANFWRCVNAFNAIGIRVVLCYIPRWYWQQIGKPDLTYIPGLLIQSSYVYGTGTASGLYPGDNSSYWDGFGGRGVDILQFTDKATIAGMSLDANAFRGSKADLAAALGLMTEDDMTGEEHDKLFQVWGALFNPVVSTSKYHTEGESGTPTKDKVTSIDAMTHEALVERNALLGNTQAIALVKREADKGDQWAAVVYAKCPH